MKKGCIVGGIALFAVVVLLSLALTLSRTSPVLGAKVGLVRVEGVILDARTIVKRLKSFRQNDSVKAVVLRINSPGGGVAPSQEIYNEVKRVTVAKPVVVSMGAVAASGGYYIAAPASWVIANPGTLTGSIGVIMEVPNVEGFMDKIGVTNQVVKSGLRKDLASAFRPMEPEERDILQRVLDDVHEQFIVAVAEGRGMGVDTVRPLADGRIYSGSQARELGLVDDLGDLEEAVAEAGRLAKIDGEPNVVGDEEEHAWKDLLRGAALSVFDIDPFGTPGMKLEYRYKP